MNIFLTNKFKAMIGFVVLTVSCFMLSLPAFCFSENCRSLNITEGNGFDLVEGPVDIVLVKNGVEKSYSYFPVECSEFLSYAGVSISDVDYINVSGDTVLYDNMLIDIATVEYEYLTVEERIPYDYELIEVDTVPKGEMKVLAEGIAGKKTITYLIKKIDGAVQSSDVVAEEIISLPAKGLAEYGVGGTVTASDGTVYSYSYKRLMEATAYTYVPGKTTWTTATGARLDKGIVAVDPREIPMHTKMYIASNTYEYGLGVAEDTGGAIKGNIIDLAFLTLEECYEFGRRNIWVYFLED